MHAPAQPQRTDHGRAHCLVAVVADAHLDALVEIDAFDRLEKTMHEVLARLLAVGDDINPGVLLNFSASRVASSLAA